MRTPSTRFRRILLSCLCLSLVAIQAVAGEAVKTFAVPAGEAIATLKQAAQQGGVEILFPATTVQGVKTRGIRGDFTPREAIGRMLEGTGLVVVQDEKTGAFAVKRDSDPNAPRVAQDSDRPGDRNKVEDGRLALDTFEVFGSKLVNADLPRSRDDIQPYVVIGRDQLEAANSLNLEDYFRTRLPMNNTGANIQPGGQLTPLNYSQISLRGLSTAQTLILIDGRRAPARGSLGSIIQADINGIPMSMIERIEILPSTASGIYGGGATGGVINIITRKDYSGVEATLSYVNTFDSDTGIKRADLNGSWALEGGKTFVTLSSSYSTSNQLLAGDRDFINRSRALQLANNPGGIYSATTPPSGYTSNIRSQNGSNLILKPAFGGTALGSPITFVPVGYAGIATSGVGPLLNNAGRYNLDLSEAPGFSGKLSSHGARLEVQSIAVSARRKFGDRLEVYTEASAQDSNAYSDTAGISTLPVTLPATATNNPFTVPIVVAWPATAIAETYTSFSETRRALAGVAVKLPRDWTAGVDFNWGQSKSGSRNPSNLVGDPDGAGPLPSFASRLAAGTLDVMRDLNAYPLNYTPYLMPKSGSESRSELSSVEWVGRASGPIWELPAGPLTLSGSLNWREDKLAPTVFETVTQVPSTYSLIPSAYSNAKSGYLEIRAPLLSAERDSLLRALELQASMRYDDYALKTRRTSATISVPGPDGPFPAVDYQTRKMDSFSQTLGFKYSPLRDLTFRASWGTGFLAPAIQQLVVNSFTSSGLIVLDPKRGGVSASTGPVTNESAGNPDLMPEDSESLSAGVVFTPRFLPGLRLSLDLTRIEKTDEIAGLSIQQLFDFEDALPGRIVRDPLTPQDQALGYTGGKVTILRTGPINVAGKRITAYDLQADYEWRSESLGQFRAWALATYQPELATQPIANAAFIETIGYNAGLKWRGNAGLDWRRGRWSASWAMQYYAPYLGYSPIATPAQVTAFILNQGSARIPSQHYHDLNVVYDFGAQAGGWRRIFSHTRVTAGVQNVFNTSPPILASTFAQNGYSFYGDPRLARYSLSVRKQF